jgi:hypothetical protein
VDDGTAFLCEIELENLSYPRRCNGQLFREFYRDDDGGWIQRAVKPPFVVKRFLYGCARCGLFSWWLTCRLTCQI